MRLIDADALIEAFKVKSGIWTETSKYLIKVIEKQPTAYSVDAVVEELEVEKERHDNDRSYWAEHEWKDRVIYNECDMSDRKSNCFDLSIDIVKRGGVE